MAELQERRPTTPQLDVSSETGAAETPSSAITLALEGMSCASCALRIEKGLKKVPGVADAAVNFATERATVSYDPTRASVDDLLAKVKATGYAATPALERTAPVPPPPTKAATEGRDTVDLVISGMTCAS